MSPHARSLFLASQGLSFDDQDLARERQRDQILGQLGQFLGRKILACLQHHLQPQGEAIRVEGLVLARSPGAPQIVVEDAPELVGGGEGDDLAAIFQPDVVDESAQGARGQGLDRRHQVGLVENARKERARSGRRDACELAGHDERIVLRKFFASRAKMWGGTRRGPRSPTGRRMED